MKCPSCQSGDVVRARDSGFTICYNCGCKELTANFLEIGDKIKRDDNGIYLCDDKELTYAEVVDSQVEPKHYTDMAISPHEYNKANDMSWNEAQVIKYVSRWKNKNGKVDLLKAKWYLDDLIKGVQDSNK